MPEAPPLRRPTVLVALAILYVATGTSFLAIKTVADHLAPLPLTAVRLLGGAVLLTPFVIWRLRTDAAWPTRPQI